MAIDGRVRRSLGSEDVQTRHSHPSVGTPIDVPLPRIIRVASIYEPDKVTVGVGSVTFGSNQHRRPFAGCAGPNQVLSLSFRRALRRLSDGIGEFDKHHA